MSTIQENLQTIADSTAAIKQAIIDKGGNIEGDITTWASAISGIETGGGSGNSGITEEEIVFRGTKSSQATSVNIVGTLYAPENINRGYLVIMDYYMMLRTSYQHINSSITSINMSINYDEPLALNVSIDPILILMYSLPGDTYGKWRAKIVPFVSESGGSSN